MSRLVNISSQIHLVVVAVQVSVVEVGVLVHEVFHKQVDFDTQ